jgi:hypothetical protein
MWLAEPVGPTGQVVATDVDTRQMVERLRPGGWLVDEVRFWWCGVTACG